MMTRKRRLRDLFLALGVLVGLTAPHLDPAAGDDAPAGKIAHPYAAWPRGPGAGAGEDYFPIAVWLQAPYRRIRAADPTRPVLLNLGQGAAWDGWHGRGVRSNHPEDYPEYVRGGATYVFAVRMEDSPARACFEVQGIPEKAAAAVLGEDRAIDAPGGRFEDVFEGYEVHLYRIR
jgi:hypothetical protein